MTEPAKHTVEPSDFPALFQAANQVSLDGQRRYQMLAIVPVQVGDIGNPRLTPFAAVQIVPFRPDDALSAFALLAALDETARRVPPLPDPLPPAPAIPFGNLAKLPSGDIAGAQIAANNARIWAIIGVVINVLIVLVASQMPD